MSPYIQNIAIFAGLFGGLGLALEIGFHAGRRAAERDEARASGQVGAIQGALLGLLGLLLAFSFSAAGARFLERQDLIVSEANAIGTAYLRADLVDEPHRSELRATLKRYTEHRLAVSARLHSGVQPSDLEEAERLHARMWSAAVAGVTARPASTIAVLPPVNEVIDLHSTRLAAGRKHVPLIVLVLLLSCSMLAVGVIGFGCGMGGGRRVAMTVPLAVVIASSLWITIDLDHPRAGLMQISDAPLRELKLDAP
jgi:hypothetical protein